MNHVTDTWGVLQLIATVFVAIGVDPEYRVRVTLTVRHVVANLRWAMIVYVVVLAVTLKVNDVGAVAAGLPFTIIVKVPIGVELVVLMVRVLVNVGLPEAGLKAHDAKVGRPLHEEGERVTDCVVPVSRVAVILFEPELPCATVIPPEFDNE